MDQQILHLVVPVVLPIGAILLVLSTIMNATSTTTNSDAEVVMLQNYIHGTFVAPHNNNNNDQTESEYTLVTNPANGMLIGKVPTSNTIDVEHAIQSSSTAFISWSQNYTMKARATIILKFHALIQEHAMELAQLIVRENGKNITEALADIAKGNETVEYAGSIANGGYGAGRTLPVSSGNIVCEDRRVPIGVVVSIVPFNFPFMVPMWTIPIALVMGNTVIVKPSEKVPLTMQRTMALWEEAGLPPGCLNLVHGTRTTVEALITHPKIRGVTFVGSSPVAHSIAQQCNPSIRTPTAATTTKRCIALGGAKNHLIALSDCTIDSTAQDIVTSFCGCAGQRCMAASVLLLVNNCSNTNAHDSTTTTTSNNTSDMDDEKHTSVSLSPLSPELSQLVQVIVTNASKLEPGTGAGQMGPVIDARSYEKIVSYIESAIRDGAQLLLDGRSWLSLSSTKEASLMGGHWMGPTILLHQNSTDQTMVEEVFGPVLSIYACSSWKEAIQIENSSPFGNAAAIYTNNGGHAQYFLSQFKAAMLGCNIGIPVPREPFSFGGLYGSMSKYGCYPGDITGDSAIEFFTNRIKVTSKWPSIDPTVFDNNSNANGKKLKLTTTTDNTTTEDTDKNNTSVDHANFAGRM
jgi:malonate-semialdehyde dehydrogenase (acetylating) / methylmalonate-semialdehyde dehydrogenase